MFQSSKCDGKTTSPLWQSRSYQPGEFLFLLFTSSSFLHALRFAAILCKCVTCLSVLFTRYLCDTVLKRSKEKHQVQTFGAILLVWLPSCCRLTWTVSYTEVSALLREVVTQIRGHTVGPPPHHGLCPCFPRRLASNCAYPRYNMRRRQFVSLENEKTYTESWTHVTDVIRIVCVVFTLSRSFHPTTSVDQENTNSVVTDCERDKPHKCQNT